jgi:vitamin B12 transporter
MIRSSWMVLVIFIASVQVGHAQETKPPEMKTLEPVVVTATKVETPQERIGATVTVIAADEIRTYNYDRIEEALRTVPGVDIQRSGGLGKTTSITIRGAGSSQVQVLVDGMRVKSPTLGSADLSELTLAGIDRIEIVRGPQATLHGADAIGGVVNIITRKGAGPVSGTTWFEGGSYETFRESAGVQGAYRGFNVNLSGSRLDSNGQFPNDDTGQTSVGGRVGYDFPWKGELSLTGRYTRLDLGLPINTTVPRVILDPNQESQTETYLATLAYKQDLFGWWHLNARYGQWWNNQGFQNSPPPATDTVTISQIDTRRVEGELINSFDLTRWDTLTLGAEHRSEVGRNTTGGTSPSRFREDINTTSLYAQDEVRILERVFLTGGVRRDDNDVFGGETTGRASAAVLFKETGSKLRFAWGTGFRAPTINDLFFPGFGNPALQPETSESYEIGVDQKLWKNRLRAGLTFFHNRFQNLIQFGFDPVTGQFLPQNVGRARTEGVESSVEVDPLDWMTLYANYTFTDTEELSTGRELRRFPRHRVNTGVTVTPVDRLMLFLQARVVSSQLELPSTGARNPGYSTIDTGGTFRLLGRAGVMERLELTARVQNLTDERYDEVRGFRALGFNALVGLRAYYQ